MRRISLLMLAVAVVACTETRASVDTAGTDAELLPPGAEWGPAPPSLPAGARIAVLEGDPTQAQPFTMRALLPDGYIVPPHSHPSRERLTIIAGTFQYGMGETFSESELQTVTAGGYRMMEPGMNHFVRVIGETVIQVHGTGPWVVNYVNPADDPSRR